MMATAISGFSRTIDWTKSRSLSVCIGSSSITTSSFLAAAACPGVGGAPPPEGAATLIEASSGGSTDDADRLVVERSIHNAQIANRPSPTAPPHWLKSDVTVFKVEGVIVGAGSWTDTN